MFLRKMFFFKENIKILNIYTYYLKKNIFLYYIYNAEIGKMN